MCRVTEITRLNMIVLNAVHGLKDNVTFIGWKSEREKRE